MAERKRYFLKCICFPMLFLFGCSTSLEKQVQKEHSVNIGQLEKRIDDLSGKINLVVTDANVLHNEMDATKTSNAIIQKKINGLEATVVDLNERITRLTTPANTPDIAPSHTETTPVISNVFVTDSEPSTTPASSVQDAENTGDLLAVARGFWDAMNARDIQAVMPYITKESRDTLQMKETDAIFNRKVTFGEVKTEDKKTSIETTMQPYPETPDSKVRMQTILVKEDEQWKVDVGQTMASMPGGAMAETIQGIDEAMEAGLGVGTEEGEKALATGMQQGLQELPRTSDTQAAIISTKQESKVVTTEINKQAEIAGSQKDTGEIKQTGETHRDTMPPKQETAVIGEAGSPEQRETFLKENIARLAETEFPDQKGLQWNILNFEHKAHLTYAEVEPTPATIGYPRIKFAVSFKNPETPRVIGTYCFKDGQYSLLSTKKN